MLKALVQRQEGIAQQSQLVTALAELDAKNAAKGDSTTKQPRPLLTPAALRFWVEASERMAMLDPVECQELDLIPRTRRLSPQQDGPGTGHARLRTKELTL
ncbi:hypothetical protein CYMTET_26301 [Cymbomonas tetramitiformis]|uniref:Uncharacterized protein n=1 Tax=Cymbomonas tetramitiformis TaxID=36881 RepID=A0AAE0FSK4_9CHLO|nr:hypothetical protein CYMTET_26301 [Cymbomonas tetramitiformis]